MIARISNIYFLYLSEIYDVTFFDKLLHILIIINNNLNITKTFPCLFAFPSNIIVLLKSELSFRVTDE